MGYVLQNFDAFDLWRIEHCDLADFTKFVLRINYEHHLNVNPPAEEIEAYIKEDERLHKCTHSYALKTKAGQIFGTINACLWDGKAEMAIERIYNISISQLIEARNSTPPEVWHIGRFAIDRKIIEQNESLRAKQGFFFKLLMTQAFAHICTNPDNLMIVECDKKLWKTGKLFGIFSESLSDGLFVLGSETLPVIDTGAGLRPFYRKHKHLLGHV